MGITLTTDQSGTSTTNICTGGGSTSSSITFNFSVTNNDILDSAIFSIKKGSNTTRSITATIYSGPNASGSIIQSASVLANNVSQSFSNISFIFSNNTTLISGTSYSLSITSSTGCSGTNPYSIRIGNFQVVDSSTGNLINTGYGVSAYIESLVTVFSSAIQVNPKIKLGNNIPIKIYLGNQQRRIYHNNAIIVDKP